MDHSPPPYGPAQPVFFEDRPELAPGPAPQPQWSTPEPPTNVGWVIAAFLLFWPTAIPALFAFQRATRALGAGDWNTATSEGATVKKFGMISVWIAIGITVLYLLVTILWATLMVASLGTVFNY